MFTAIAGSAAGAIIAFNGGLIGGGVESDLSECSQARRRSCAVRNQNRSQESDAVYCARDKTETRLRLRVISGGSEVAATAE